MLQFEWDNFDFTLQHFGRGVFTKDMAGHSHSKNSYELHYITNGEGTLTTDNQSYALHKGVFFVTGPNVYHQQSTNLKNPLTEIYIYIQSSERKTNTALASTFLSTHFFLQECCPFAELFEQLLQENEEKKWGYRNNISALMQLLMTEITRAYWPNHVALTENNSNQNDKRFILIENAFIDHPEDLTLHSLSELIGLCERQTQRLLQKYYGKSFKEKKAEALGLKR